MNDLAPDNPYPTRRAFRDALIDSLVERLGDLAIYGTKALIALAWSAVFAACLIALAVAYAAVWVSGAVADVLGWLRFKWRSIGVAGSGPDQSEDLS